MIEVKCPKCGYPWLVSICVTCDCGTVLYAYKGLHQDDDLRRERQRFTGESSCVPVMPGWTGTDRYPYSPRTTIERGTGEE